MNLRVMAMKEYTTLPRSPGLEFHHQMKLSVIPKIPFLGEKGSYFYAEYTVSVF